MACAIVAGGFEKYYETRTACASPFVSPADADTKELFENTRGEASLILEKVRCSACLWLIEQVLRRVPGVTRADVNYATRRAQVAWDPQRTGLAHLVAAIRTVGYDATPYEPRRQAALERRERRDALWRLFVAGFGAMQVMMYAFPSYLGAQDLSAEAASLMRWASLLITTPVLAFSCGPFFAGARREAASGRIGLDTPIALGLAGGFAASAWATIAGSGEVYFDSICMLAFLLLAARYAQDEARRRAASGLDRLLAWVPSAALAPGDRVGVAPGERAPADGVVESGVSSADESLLTGESRPVAKHPGDALVGGSVNLEQPLVMRVTRAGADTQAAAIARLAERAAASRPQLVDDADRVARMLTYVVIATAAAAALYWGDAWVAVAVLVVTCPCALGLAAPIVLTRANGWLLGRGALLTRIRSLEALERVSDVVLDKTGTLTLGRLSLSRVVPLGALDEPACRGLAAALEGSSAHPIARALSLGAGEGGASVEQARHVAGEGIEAFVDGSRIRIGTREFCEALSGKGTSTSVESTLHTQVFLCDESGWLALLELEDEIRPDALRLIDSLKAKGVAIHLLSGDDPAVVAQVAARLGIATFAGRMTPRAKLEYVERLQHAGRTVAMAGDGLNDAPVLAGADVSFAMGGGADAAQLRADVVLTGNSLDALSQSFGLARRAMRLVRQNIGWALAYNAVALPLAAAGWIGPWEAALGMGASSLLVAANALRPLQPRHAWKASTSSSRSRSLSYS